MGPASRLVAGGYAFVCREPVVISGVRANSRRKIFLSGGRRAGIE